MSAIRARCASAARCSRRYEDVTHIFAGPRRAAPRDARRELPVPPLRLRRGRRPPRPRRRAARSASGPCRAAASSSRACAPRRARRAAALGAGDRRAGAALRGGVRAPARFPGSGRATAPSAPCSCASARRGASSPPTSSTPGRPISRSTGSGSRCSAPSPSAPSARAASAPVLALAGLGAMGASYLAGYEHALGASGLVMGLAGALLWIEFRAPDSVPVDLAAAAAPVRRPRGLRRPRSLIGAPRHRPRRPRRRPARRRRGGGRRRTASREGRPRRGLAVANALALAALLLSGIAWAAQRRGAGRRRHRAPRRGAARRRARAGDLLNNEAWRIAISEAPSPDALDVARRMAERAAEETRLVGARGARHPRGGPLRSPGAPTSRARSRTRQPPSLRDEAYYREQRRRFAGERGPAGDRPPGPSADAAPPRRAGAGRRRRSAGDEPRPRASGCDLVAVLGDQHRAGEASPRRGAGTGRRRRAAAAAARARAAATPARVASAPTSSRRVWSAPSRASASACGAGRRDGLLERRAVERLVHPERRRRSPRRRARPGPSPRPRRRRCGAAALDAPGERRRAARRAAPSRGQRVSSPSRVAKPSPASSASSGGARGRSLGGFAPARRPRRCAARRPSTSARVPGGPIDAQRAPPPASATPAQPVVEPEHVLGEQAREQQHGRLRDGDRARGAAPARCRGRRRPARACRRARPRRRGRGACWFSKVPPVPAAITVERLEASRRRAARRRRRPSRGDARRSGTPTSRRPAGPGPRAPGPDRVLTRTPPSCCRRRGCGPRGASAPRAPAPRARRRGPCARGRRPSRGASCGSRPAR